jgi:hypothetical protein
MHALPKMLVSRRFMKVPQRFAFGLCSFKSPIDYVVVPSFTTIADGIAVRVPVPATDLQDIVDAELVV